MAGKRSKGGYDGKIAGLYDLEETIGQGHFAVVKLARHVFTGEKVAVKVIDKQKLDDISRSHLFQEVRCMKLVQHPNVVRLYEVIDTQTKLYLILELGDGDMYDYIMKHDDGLDEAVAKKYFQQIVEAITYCHRLHVVHRDLKPENVVFFNKLGIVKLTDFGFSNVFAPGKKLETSCGSLAYSAPEILLGDSYDPPAVDVWSLGVILFMLVAGRAPFQEANDSETLTMIMDCKYQIPPQVSAQCRSLITRMLVREPSQRINLQDIEQDPWLGDVDSPDSGLRISLPLLSREHVSEEDHNYVVQKMVEGKICSRDEIFQSLERDAYDHIAATYYLLVERRLRKLQQQEVAASSANNLRKQSAPSTNIAAGKPHLEPLMLSPRKQKEMKKTKTAPVHKCGGIPPTLVITPPIVEEPGARGVGSAAVSPGGPDFVKSLTTSMTLDRRTNHRKKLEGPSQHRMTMSANLGLPSPASAPASAPSGPLIPKMDEKGKPQQRVRSAPLTTHEGVKAVVAKKKSSAPSFSKIAILSSFFERKAAQESGALPPPQPHQRLFPWMGGRDRKVQSAGPDHCDPSNLVQSLVSPPGTHPSPASASPGMSQLSPEAMFAAIRKCSLIREESQDDDDDDDLDDFDMDSCELKPSKSLEFLDERSSDFSPASGPEVGLMPKLSQPPSAGHDPVNPRRPLKSVCSSPQLLNQIHEENESEDEDDFVPLKLSAPRGRYSHSGMASPEILRKYEQRRRRRGAGQRGASCSSSDASDTDDTEGRSRKDSKLKHKFVHRRDSSDHSSDTDGPSGGNNLGGGGRIGNGGSGAKTSSGGRSSRRDGGGGGGDGRGGGGNGGGSGGKGHQHNSRHHTLCASDSRSSGEDPNEWPVASNGHVTLEFGDENIDCSNNQNSNLKTNNFSKISLNNKRNHLTRQNPVIGHEGLAILNTDLHLLALSQKLSSISSTSPLSGGISLHSNTAMNNSNTLNNNNNKITGCLTSVLVAPAPSHERPDQYLGQHYPSPLPASSDCDEFSQISEYCERLMESQTSAASLCTGDCGPATGSRLNPAQGAPTCCKVGSAGPGLQVESKCCSVV
ncbi:SNF-related serine/threonine-protein kinase isoform X2 [Aplysia californica]|uniref:SNF-related serine/threonine-protein kinase isoform X2 n=1 Tax=Aplysia californica TaxID=6500 RepID=A0ABM0JGN8_APLCA|nr:SNF-related serine/threonine-protein kinase isoform X2 [Aplysia californica]